MLTDICIPKTWLNEYTIPIDFGRVQRPDQFLITDTDVPAGWFVIVGWVVENRRHPDGDLIVGTVICHGDPRNPMGVVESISHGHVYIKRLPGRRIETVEPWTAPYNVVAEAA